MIRRTFIKRFSAGVLGCGMLADALLSRGPSMEVVETLSHVATTPYRGDDFMELGPRVSPRTDLTHSFEPMYADKRDRPWATLDPNSYQSQGNRYRRSIRLGVLHERN